MTLTVTHSSPSSTTEHSDVANMKLSFAALFALSCIYWKVSGQLVEVVVRLGDNATLHCDCELITGQEIQWVKIWSPKTQQPLTISAYNSLFKSIPRFSLSWNNTSKSLDLVIENITEADLGLYYCSRVETRIEKENEKISEKDWFHTGDSVIHLIYSSPVFPSESPPEPIDCWQCWLILQTVCPTCALLSAILAFVCGYSCCHKTVLKESEARQSSSEMQRQLSQEEDAHREVCYASLNIPKRGNQRTKSNRLPNSDFSVYNSVKMHTQGECTVSI
ncbi:uncharacterized protein [Pseudorasbora parva]|uniref:uncharacterized protein n=1 Tax=Pseudorasbora parva TaxID=51549 RepID=UPI00351E6890